MKQTQQQDSRQTKKVDGVRLLVETSMVFIDEEETELETIDATEGTKVAEDDDTAGDDDAEHVDDDDDYILTPKDTVSAILPKVTSILSIMGSFWIISELLATDRLLVSISVSDLSFSFAWFFSTWAAPVETSNYIRNPNGTTATCSAQGFFV